MKPWKEILEAAPLVDGVLVRARECVDDQPHVVLALAKISRSIIAELINEYRKNTRQAGLDDAEALRDVVDELVARAHNEARTHEA